MLLSKLLLRSRVEPMPDSLSSSSRTLGFVQNDLNPDNNEPEKTGGKDLLQAFQRFFLIGGMKNKLTTAVEPRAPYRGQQRYRSRGHGALNGVETYR